MTTAEVLRQLASALEENETFKTRVAILEARLRVATGQQPLETQEWFSSAEAARFIGRSTGFLEMDRRPRDGEGRPKSAKIPYKKHGHRTVRYHRPDLEAYLEHTSKGRLKKAA